MTRWSAILGAAAALGIASAAAGADRMWHPYREVSKNLGLTGFNETPESQRDQLRLAYTVEPKVVQGEPLTLTIRTAARAVRVVADARGHIEVPFDARWLDENPDVFINLPAGDKASFNADLRPRLPQELQTDYVHFAGSVKQANAMIRKQAGMLSVFAPKLRKLVLEYPRAAGQQVTLGSGAGQQVLRVAADGRIVVPFDDELYTRNVRVVISDPPQDADLEE